jgi:hypothetical protein
MPCVMADPNAALRYQDGPRLPADFVPVSAARCLLIDDGAREGTTWIRAEQVALGGLAALASALRLPSEPPQGLPCPYPVPIGVTLTDRRGTSVVPNPPRNFCGQPLPAVSAAIDALPWRTVSRTRVART